MPGPASLTGEAVCNFCCSRQRFISEKTELYRVDLGRIRPQVATQEWKKPPLVYGPGAGLLAAVRQGLRGVLIKGVSCYAASKLDLLAAQPASRAEFGHLALEGVARVCGIRGDQRGSASALCSCSADKTSSRDPGSNLLNLSLSDLPCLLREFWIGP
ncbi:uncharacterized protein ACIBXB_016908 isoform 2-T6 [Morphnus guianensis]